MRFDFYSWLVTKDIHIIRVANFIRDAKRIWGLSDYKARNIGRKLVKTLAAPGKDLFIALNGPSIQKQPIERIKGMDCIFVNQGFRLPQYRELKPRFHIFIDKKLIDGTWDITWLDQIHDMVPDIVFVMPPSWAKSSKIKPYIEKGYRILWWSAPRLELTHGVSGFAFQLAWELRYKRVYFSGYEQTATPAYILKRASHFYGSDPDVRSHDARYIMKDLSMNARHLAAAFRSAEFYKRKGMELVNLTDGGIMDMFQRKRFEEVFPA